MKPTEEDLRIAVEIVTEWNGKREWSGVTIFDKDRLAESIASAIAAEREKAAKVAEDHFESDKHLYHSGKCTADIARLIRRINSDLEGFGCACAPDEHGNAILCGPCRERRRRTAAIRAGDKE